MKWKILILSCVFAVAAAHAATNDLTGLLQKGLFEEEANRDLDAAISNYQMLAGQFDKDRQTAATAIFRLGECYRKLGKTNEAAAQYQRILREFPDQQTLSTLSQQNLTGLGVSGGTQAGQTKNVSIDMQAVQQQIVSAQAQLAESEAMLKNLKSMNSHDLREALPGLIPDDQLNTLMNELNLAEQQLINLRNEYSQDHPRYKSAEAEVGELNKKVDDRIDGILLGLQAKVNAETAYLDALKAKSQDLQSNASATSPNGQNAAEQSRATQAQL
ncbi:MAG TPA: tetratricopeptide repeat protein, partial [Candidatus Polarisedimenticolia bacterium]|nr:tetratricopeptide repeat protein [Candidatus Polarisedimenticolia bacterium]